VGHYPILFQPADGVLHHHPLRSQPLVKLFLLGREGLRLHASFASPRASPLIWQRDIEFGIVVPYPFAAKVHPQTHLVRQPRAAPLEEGVVVPASPGVWCPVEDQAGLVHGYLGLDGVPFLLAAVVCSPLTLVLGPGDLLLGGVKEGLEAGEELLQVLEGSPSFGSPVYLLGQRQDRLHQWLEYAYVLEHVALSEVEEEAQEGGGYVEAAVHMQHQEPVSEG